MVWTTTVSSKGQVVLPKAVRQKLDVKPGSKLVLAERNGHIELRAYSGDIMSWYGAQPVDGPQDWNQVKKETVLARAREAMHETKSD